MGFALESVNWIGIPPNMNLGVEMKRTLIIAFAVLISAMFLAEDAMAHGCEKNLGAGEPPTLTVGMFYDKFNIWALSKPFRGVV